MADHFYGIDRGVLDHVPSAIQRDTSTTAADMELRIGDGFGWTRKEIVCALAALTSLFEAGGGKPDGTNFPPI